MNMIDIDTSSARDYALVRRRPWPSSRENWRDQPSLETLAEQERRERRIICSGSSPAGRASAPRPSSRP